MVRGGGSEGGMSANGISQGGAQATGNGGGDLL